MFERFGNRSRMVVVHAQEEARALHHGWIGTEHLLLALVRDHRGMGASVLESMGAGEARVRDRLGHYLDQLGTTDQGTPPGHIPFTPRAKRVLELGLREALQLGHEIIGTEHLLLALIREEDGLAGKTLHDLGIHLDAARAQVLTRHPPQPGVASPAETPPRVVTRPLREEVQQLRIEVDRLRALLRRHDIDPDAGSGGESGSESTP